jgi:hypothetical protein
MRIAIIQRSFYTPGGAERVLDQLIRLLTPRHEFALFTFEYQTMHSPHLDGVMRFVIESRRPFGRHLRRYFDAKRNG